MDTTPTISVIIATRNRSASLREVLNDLAAQATDGRFRYEVIVVDNTSTDQTRLSVERLAAAYPVPLRYLFETTPGKSYALNRGIAHARGAVIAMTDDDVRVEPTWLAVIHRAFDEQGVDGIGGPTKPLWVGTRPAWLSDRLVKQLGMVDYGAEPFVVKDTTTPFIGPNCAYRRSLFGRYGGFDEHRSGASEDVDWFLRLFRAGCTLVYQPRMAVLHRLEADRLTVRAMAGRFFRHGRACALGLQEKGQARAVCRVPLWVVRYWLALHWQAAACWLRGERDEALWHWLRRNFYLGAIWYCFKDWVQQRPVRQSTPLAVQRRARA